MTKTHFKKEFLKTLNEVDERERRVCEGFDSFLECAFFAFVQSTHTLQSGRPSQHIEESYLSAVKRVKNPKTLPKLLGILTDALDSQGPHDFLGEIYMSEEMGNPNAGQFFTPYPVSRAIASITLNGKTPSSSRRLTLNDPACGSGSTLLASFEVLKGLGFKQNQVYFVAQDVDVRCVRMAYLHFTLLDIPGVVEHANTLTLQSWGSWETIGYARCPYPKPDFTDTKQLPKRPKPPKCILSAEALEIMKQSV